MKCYLVSHNGLGDNLYMIGALRYISQFYDNVYFLCKKRYYQNVKLFFINRPSIICIPFDETNERNDIMKILAEKYKDQNTDIFICGGFHKSYLKSKITNNIFRKYKIIDENYKIDYDTLTSQNYSFIEEFYKDITLNLTYFYKYFSLPSTNESKRLYESVKQYYTIFIQYKSSDGKTLNISNLLSKYINKDNTLLICNDKNLYTDMPDKAYKYQLAQKFVYEKVIYYLDIIKNSNEIYLIDSCFIGIVLPLLKTNQLKAKTVRIILRNETDRYIL